MIARAATNAATRMTALAALAALGTSATSGCQRSPRDAEAPPASSGGTAPADRSTGGERAGAPPRAEPPTPGDPAAPGDPAGEPPVASGRPAGAAPPAEAPRRATGSEGCVRGGCSSELCVESGSDVKTACMYRPEYACYDDARCERGPDGKCGWVQTPELEQCLENPPQE